MEKVFRFAQVEEVRMPEPSLMRIGSGVLV
jgi:hypothetical protein